MAISNAAVFECRAGGSDLNSGGNVVVSGGTDYSQSTSPHVTFDGSTITATTTGAGATITITGYTTATTDKGNLVRIAGGTNFIAGLYQITNTGTGTWTLDRNCTSGAGTGMTGRMGGCIATLQQFVTDTDANTNVLGGYICWVVGTLTLTTPLVFASAYNTNDSGGNTNTTFGGVQISGYTTTRGDNGRFTLTTATDSTDLIHFGISVCNVSILNCSFTTTASTKSAAIRPTGNGHEPKRLMFQNCAWDGFTRAFYCDASNDQWIDGLTLIACEVKNCTTAGIVSNSATFIFDSFIHDNTGDGVLLSSSAGNLRGPFVSVRSTYYNNTGKGVNNGQPSNSTATMGATTYLVDSNFVSNGGDGYGSTIPSNNGLSILLASGNIFYGNGGYGVDLNHIYGFVGGGNNGFGSNTTADRNICPVLPGDFSLTADPFTAKGSANFAPNSTAGGGAALPYTVTELFGSGSRYAGALQPSFGSAPFLRNDSMNGGF